MVKSSGNKAKKGPTPIASIFIQLKSLGILTLSEVFGMS